MSSERITLGGGCFWCLEAVFQRLRGVRSVTSGYAGGELENPDYQQICTGSTGHAEVVQIEFDADVISVRELLEVFFDIHDPTTLNRQGADTGSQYRSVIFYHDDAQRQQAERMISALEKSGRWTDPIVTELLPVPEFYAAESYHQDYFNRHPGQGYCQVVISPKLEKLYKQHQSLLDAGKSGA